VNPASPASPTSPANPILIVIPTLDKAKGESVGKMALATSGCSVPVRVFVSHDRHGRGFTRTANAGMRQARTDEDICLLNDDILRFQYGWLEILRRVLYSNPSYGLSGPSGPSGASPMNKGVPGQTGVQVVRQISFWCVLMKREMLDELGYLDEAFIHYCSDNWYCLTMRKRGWQCVWAKSVYLHHRKHGSGLRGDWRKHDRAIFFKRGGEG